MRVALVHEWLITYAGSEKVLAEMLAQFPDADMFCLIDASRGKYASAFAYKLFRPSFLQCFAWLERFATTRGAYRYLLPIMPIAMEQLDLSGYDLVISNSHAVAKSVITGPDQIHISYCYTPMRYAWDLQHQYLRDQRITGIRGMLARWLLHKIRMWDTRTANGVDHFIACSSYIQRRIWRVYRRKSTVVYPGVDTDYYAFSPAKRADVYVTASRLVPYKKVALIAEAFARMPNRQLVIIGDGPQYRQVARFAGPNVSVLGYQPDEVLLHHLQTAKAYIFAAEEDFGISPLEAQACGTPVLAFGRGGACETIVDGETGFLFAEQTTASIQACVERFEREGSRFDPLTIRGHAENFSLDRFRREFRIIVESFLAAHKSTHREQEQPAIRPLPLPAMVSTA